MKELRSHAQQSLQTFGWILLLVTMTAARQSQGPTAVPDLPLDIPPSAERYSVLIMGNLAGQQAIWSESDGSLHVFFQYNDRGRGPKTTSVLKLKDAVPVSESINGNDYQKSPVSESYSFEGGVFRWMNSSEHGEKTRTTPAMYIPINSAPAELALLVRAARANGGKISLLPEGEAQVTRLATRDLANSAQRKRVVMYSITGLDFSPVYLWLDASEKFFAVVDPWMTVAPQGWENAVQPLQTTQDGISQARSAELAHKLAHHPSRGILFKDANVFDAEHRTLLKNRDVLVAGNRIRSLSATGQLAVPPGVEVIDATGKTLLPGLWDMHAHVDSVDGLLNLAAGVTTVRDLGNDIDTLLARRKRIEEGSEIGTRIILAGIIDGRGPYQGPTKVLVSSEKEARAAVDEYKRLGYVQIKIYSSVKPELVPAIIDEAHKNGMRVSGHIPAGMTAAQCVGFGFDEIQHANFLVLNFFPEIKNTDTPARLTEVAMRGAELDLKSSEMQSFIKLLQDHHTVLDPTLNVFESRFLDAGEIPRGYLPISRRLPAQVRRGLLSSGLTPPSGMTETYQKSFARMVELVGLMYRSGVPLEFGTDSMAGFSLHHELELGSQAGIPPAEVLQDATLNAARIMKLDRDLGSVTPGKLADVVLINGDPTSNISDIRKTAVVVKDGVLYRPAELYSAIGVEP